MRNPIHAPLAAPTIAPVVLPPPASPDPAPQSQADPNSNQQQQIKTSTSYMTVPGKITDSDGKGGYTVTLYVNGVDESGSRSVSVKEINQDSGLDVGTYTMVSAIIKMKMTTTTVLNQFGAPSSTNTSIKIQSEKYYCQVGGGGGGTPAKITGGGPGKTYQATLYPQGPDGDAGDDITLTQLQIDDDSTIPVDTWVIAVKGKSKKSTDSGSAGESGDSKKVYFAQAPIWL